MSEKSSVQDPLIKYATQIGWAYLNRDEAAALRGGETGLFFYDILKEKLIRLNKGIVNDGKAKDIIKKLENVKSSIESNQEILQYLKAEKSVYSDKEKRELNIKFIDFENLEIINFMLRMNGSIPMAGLQIAGIVLNLLPVKKQ